MASIVHSSRIEVYDGNGDPVSGAKIYFFDAGTATPRVIYTDAALMTAHAVPIVCDSAGRSALIYINPAGGDYKIRVDDAADVTIYTDDDISPALGSPIAVANGGTGATDAATARTNLGVAASSTVTALDTRLTTAEATIAGPYVWAYDAITFTASWTPDFASDRALSMTLTGGVTVNAPTNTTNGGIYAIKLVQDATGGRTVAFNSSFKWRGGRVPNFSTAPNAVDIVIFQDGGSVFEVLALYIQDGIDRNPVAVIQHQQTSGTPGGTATSGSWQTYPLTTIVRNIGTIASLASNEVTLPAGSYRIRAKIGFYQTRETKIRLFDVTGAGGLDESPLHGSPTAGSITHVNHYIDQEWVVSPTASNAYRVEYWCGATRATDGLGNEGSLGGAEIYAQLSVDILR